MTIIAVKDGVMAADSMMFTGNLMHPVAFPKITRGPGGLIGLSGRVSDTYFVSRWFLEAWTELGQWTEPGHLPVKLDGGDNAILALILRPDGSVWMMDERLAPWPATTTATLGYETACAFCDGAMAAGASAEQAVRMAIERCTHIGGEVQVERL